MFIRWKHSRTVRHALHAALVGIAALAVATPATPASAHAANAATAASPCPFSHALCLFDGTNFTGERFTVTSLNPNGVCVSLVAHGWGDRARSAINTHSNGAAMFMNDNCLGDPFQIPGNSSLPSFGGFTPESVWVPSS